MRQQSGEGTEAIYREFHARLLSAVRRRVTTEQDAEDIVQSVFARAHAHREELASAQSVSGWLFRVTHNAITDYYRSRGAASRAAERLAQEPAFPAEPADALDVAQALSHCIAPFVAELPSPYREALELTELGGLSQAEAAAKVGISQTGMRSRVQRGRTKLGSRLLSCCEVELDARRHVIDCAPRTPRDPGDDVG